ncbi:MAG TPA: TIGR02594 family protein, partial [Tianweitania sediminis]|nr:TIGR02594 family protein [Tianweitania sediminis]
MSAASNTAATAVNKFAPFRTEIEQFIGTVREGNPDIIALYDAISRRITNANSEEVRRLGGELLNLIGAAYDTQRALGGASNSITTLGTIAVDAANQVAHLSEGLRKLNSYNADFAANAAKQTQYTDAFTVYAESMRGLDEEMSQGAISFEDYARGQEQLAAALKTAKDGISGLSEAQKELNKYERDAQIGGMSERAASIARVRDEAEAMRKSLADAGASTDDLNRAQAAADQQIAAVNKKFDEQEQKAGNKGAAKALRENEKAAQDLIREYDRFSASADRMVDKLFPGQGALRELKELQEQYAKFGGSLDKYQDAAVQSRMQELKLAAHMGMRDLPEATREKGEEASNALHDTLGQALEDIFSGNIQNAEDLFDTILSGLADIGRAFAKQGIDRLLGNITGKGAGGGGFGTGFPEAPRLTAGNDNRAPWEGLRDLTKSMEGTSKSALDVARQFEGLNERADTKVLDNFLQASGTWKGMSSQDFAWCASFANAAIITAGGKGTGSNAASSFLNWGMGTNNPQPGDIVVLKPQARGATGHVGFVAGFGDGTVEIFGGNQSHGANTKSYGLDQVVGYRTDPRILAKGVEEGTVAASNKLGIAPIAAGAQPQGAVGGFMQNGGMGVLGAGAGAFAQGFQSGSPFGGGLSGAMSGFGAAPAIASAFPALAGIAGPIGMIGGAALGFLGGLFGKKRQQKQEQEQAK